VTPSGAPASGTPASGTRATVVPAVWTVLLGSVLAVSVAQTLPGAALPVMAADLGRRDLVAWPVAATLLASTMAGPLLSRAGDKYGRRAVLRLSLAGMLVAGLLSGVAPTMAWMITCRALLGVANGGLITVSAAAVSEAVPKPRYAQFQSWSLVLTSIATVVAPVAGGAISDLASWRWAFLATVTIPLVLLPLSRHLPAGSRHPVAFDLGGAVLLPLTAGALLAGLQVATHGREAAARSLATALVVTGVLAGLAFVAQERRASDPMVPLAMFADRLFARCAVLSLLCGAVLFASSVQLQNYLQVGQGVSAATAGLLLTPLSVAVAATSVAYGRLARRDGVGRRLMHGCLTMTAGLGLLMAEGQQPGPGPGPAFLPATVLLGAGLGIVLPGIGTVAQLGVKPGNVGRAVSVMHVTRTLGGAIGTTVTAAFIPVSLSATPAGHPVPSAAGALSGWGRPFLLMVFFGAMAVLVVLPLRHSVVALLSPRHRS
jgi:MFS family permease